MNKQKQYYINGLILIVIALLAITIVPHYADKLGFTLEKTSYREFEFFALSACALFFLFSPKYYKNQILSVVLALAYYFLFLKIYPFL